VLLRLVLPFCLRLQLAASFICELAGYIWRLIHVTHLLSVVLMDGRASAPEARRQNAGPGLRPDGLDAVRTDNHGQVQAIANRSDGADSKMADSKMIALVQAATGGRTHPGQADT
jgi:hypothetical protein